MADIKVCKIGENLEHENATNKLRDIKGQRGSKRNELVRNEMTKKRDAAIANAAVQNLDGLMRSLRARVEDYMKTKEFRNLELDDLGNNKSGEISEAAKEVWEQGIGEGGVIEILGLKNETPKTNHLTPVAKSIMEYDYLRNKNIKTLFSYFPDLNIEYEKYIELFKNNGGDKIYKQMHARFNEDIRNVSEDDEKTAEKEYNDLKDRLDSLIDLDDDESLFLARSLKKDVKKAKEKYEYIQEIMKYEKRDIDYIPKQEQMKKMSKDFLKSQGEWSLIKKVKDEPIDYTTSRFMKDEIIYPVFDEEKKQMEEEKTLNESILSRIGRKDKVKPLEKFKPSKKFVEEDSSGFKKTFWQANRKSGIGAIEMVSSYSDLIQKNISMLSEQLKDTNKTELERKEISEKISLLRNRENVFIDSLKSEKILQFVKASEDGSVDVLRDLRKDVNGRFLKNDLQWLFKNGIIEFTKGNEKFANDLMEIQKDYREKTEISPSEIANAFVRSLNDKNISEIFKVNDQYSSLTIPKSEFISLQQKDALQDFEISLQRTTDFIQPNEAISIENFGDNNESQSSKDINTIVYNLKSISSDEKGKLSFDEQKIVDHILNNLDFRTDNNNNTFVTLKNGFEPSMHDLFMLAQDSYLEGREGWEKHESKYVAFDSKEELDNLLINKNPIEIERIINAVKLHDEINRNIIKQGVIAKDMQEVSFFLNKIIPVDKNELLQTQENLQKLYEKNSNSFISMNRKDFSSIASYLQEAIPKSTVTDDKIELEKNLKMFTDILNDPSKRRFQINKKIGYISPFTITLEGKSIYGSDMRSGINNQIGEMYHKHGKDLFLTYSEDGKYLTLNWIESSVKFETIGNKAKLITSYSNETRPLIKFGVEDGGFDYQENSLYDYSRKEIIKKEASTEDFKNYSISKKIKHLGNSLINLEKQFKDLEENNIKNSSEIRGIISSIEQKNPSLVKTTNKWIPTQTGLESAALARSNVLKFMKNIGLNIEDESLSTTTKKIRAYETQTFKKEIWKQTQNGLVCELINDETHGGKKLSFKVMYDLLPNGTISFRTNLNSIGWTSPKFVEENDIDYKNIKEHYDSAFVNKKYSNNQYLKPEGQIEFEELQKTNLENQIDRIANSNYSVAFHENKKVIEPLKKIIEEKDKDIQSRISELDKKIKSTRDKIYELLNKRKDSTRKEKEEIDKNIQKMKLEISTFETNIKNIEKENHLNIDSYNKLSKDIALNSALQVIKNRENYFMAGTNRSHDGFQFAESLIRWIHSSKEIINGEEMINAIHKVSKKFTGKENHLENMNYRPTKEKLFKWMETKGDYHLLSETQKIDEKIKEIEKAIKISGKDDKDLQWTKKILLSQKRKINENTSLNNKIELNKQEISNIKEQIRKINRLIMVKQDKFYDVSEEEKKIDFLNREIENILDNNKKIENEIEFNKETIKRGISFMFDDRDFYNVSTFIKGVVKISNKNVSKNNELANDFDVDKDIVDNDFFDHEWVKKTTEPWKKGKDNIQKQLDKIDEYISPMKDMFSQIIDLENKNKSKGGELYLKDENNLLLDSMKKHFNNLSLEIESRKKLLDSFVKEDEIKKEIENASESEKESIIAKWEAREDISPEVKEKLINNYDEIKKTLEEELQKNIRRFTVDSSKTFKQKDFYDHLVEKMQTSMSHAEAWKEILALIPSNVKMMISEKSFDIRMKNELSLMQEKISIEIGKFEQQISESYASQLKLNESKNLSESEKIQLNKEKLIESARRDKLIKEMKNKISWLLGRMMYIRQGLLESSSELDRYINQAFSLGNKNRHDSFFENYVKENINNWVYGRKSIKPKAEEEMLNRLASEYGSYNDKALLYGNTKDWSEIIDENDIDALQDLYSKIGSEETYDAKTTSAKEEFENAILSYKDALRKDKSKMSPEEANKHNEFIEEQHKQMEVAQQEYENAIENNRDENIKNIESESGLNKETFRRLEDQSRDSNGRIQPFLLEELIDQEKELERMKEEERQASIDSGDLERFNLLSIGEDFENGEVQLGYNPDPIKLTSEIRQNGIPSKITDLTEKDNYMFGKLRQLQDKEAKSIPKSSIQTRETLKLQEKTKSASKQKLGTRKERYIWNTDNSFDKFVNVSNLFKQQLREEYKMTPEERAEAAATSTLPLTRNDSETLDSKKQESCSV